MPRWFPLKTAELINLLTQKPEILLDRDSLVCDFSVVERQEGSENVVRRYGAIDQGRQLAQMPSGTRFAPGRSAIPLRTLSFPQNMPAQFQCAVSLRRLSRFHLDLTLETRPRAETSPNSSMAKALDAVPNKLPRDLVRTRHSLTSRWTSLGRFVRIPSSRQIQFIQDASVDARGSVSQR